MMRRSLLLAVIALCSPVVLPAQAPQTPQTPAAQTPAAPSRRGGAQAPAPEGRGGAAGPAPQGRAGGRGGRGGAAAGDAAAAPREPLQISTDLTGFISMFNGVDLKGWDGPMPLWHVEDGA